MAQSYSYLRKYPDLLITRCKQLAKEINNLRTDRDYWKLKSRQQEIELNMLKDAIKSYKEDINNFSEYKNILIEDLFGKNNTLQKIYLMSFFDRLKFLIIGKI